MLRDLFVEVCRHFVANLKPGQGKGGRPVLLFFDGHTSRWSYEALNYLMENNVRRGPPPQQPAAFPS